jgi:two-component system, cell cycle response regulator
VTGPDRLALERMELANRLAGPRILLVEDSDLSAAITRDILRSSGCRVTRVANGAEALDAIETLDCDLVVTDRLMPVMDGIELCAQLRRRPASAGQYVLMLTGLDRKQDIVDGLAAGADDYLTKPFDGAELLARVRAGLRVVTLQRELAAANAALSRLALTDPLTDLPNRRAVDDLLTMEAAQRDRDGGESAVAILDLDSFKAINDEHGHLVGDLALTAVAKLLRREMRAADTCGRLGGEEFVLLLRGCSLDDAVPVCERLRDEITHLRIPSARGTLSLTASVGVATIEVQARPSEVVRRHRGTGGTDTVFRRAAQNALRDADQALYRAKADGRNRVAAHGRS